MKNLPHIGTVEYLSLPSEGIQGVPAKIDTGADSSAIWATNIKEKNGVLSFSLFGQSSQFYTGNVLKVKDYQVISVKNSFGQSEFRYKVHLKIGISGKTIRAKFTLAQRQNNRYPILIGRRTLYGKFLVDVTRKVSKGKYDVLMLSTKRTPVTEKFAKNVEKSGKKLNITYAAYEDLCYAVDASGARIALLSTKRDIASFDFLHFKTTSRYMDIAAATARYLESRNVPFIDEAIKHYPGTSKLYQYIVLANSGLAIPSSLFLFPSQLKGSFELIEQAIGLPFVLKDIHGNKGEYNYLVTDKKSFAAACKETAANDIQCVAQAFIANTGDYRVLVFGSKVALVIQRSRLNDDTHLNNTSRGAKAAVVPTGTIPAVIQAACIAAAKRLERQVAGVDIIQDKASGLWYCLEVNEGPQLASGSFTEAKQAAFAAYLDRKLAP